MVSKATNRPFVKDFLIGQPENKTVPGSTAVLSLSMWKVGGKGVN